MASNKARLADMTMADLERLFRIQEAVDACDTAVQSASMPGKAAVRALLASAYHEAAAMMQKAAPAALRNAQGGMYSRRNPSQQFVNRLIQAAAAKAGGRELQEVGEHGTNE